VWTQQGFSDLNHLLRAQQKHSKSQTHVHSYLQLKLFGKQQTVGLLLDAQRRNDVTRHNEQVKKSRLILCWFIDAVCYLANQSCSMAYARTYKTL
jgi:hypothetical protein